MKKVLDIVCNRIYNERIREYCIQDASNFAKRHRFDRRRGLVEIKK